MFGNGFTVTANKDVSSGHVIVVPGGGVPATMYAYVPLLLVEGSNVLLYHIPIIVIPNTASSRRAI